LDILDRITRSLYVLASLIAYTICAAPAEMRRVMELENMTTVLAQQKDSKAIPPKSHGV
jgi:hypothetical protein